MPRISPVSVKSGKEIIQAKTRGIIRKLYGFAFSVYSASICSVTFIVPISADIDEATRPAIIKPHSTGPSSLQIPIATIEGTTLSALNRVPPE